MLRDRRPSFEDSEEGDVPKYVYAHKSCIRRNLVVIADGPSSIQRGAEPRELHRELSAVARMSSQEVSISKEVVASVLSNWYRTVYAANCSFRPLLVWLRKHPMVRSEDTLYGALNITSEEVARCVSACKRQTMELSKQAEFRRQSVHSRVEAYKQECVAELRIWLGKGYTKWRTVEDLEDLDSNILTSIGS